MNLDRKYRPTKFEEFIGNKNIVRDIQSLLKVGDMPHLMFIGPPGCGKTTMALMVASYYYGEPVKLNVGESHEDITIINASDERGIDTVRELISVRAKTRSATFDKNGVRLKRFIILEEADSLTKDAQHALRPVVELNEDRCIFIFLLNHIEGIKEPALISRCATFFFKRPMRNECAKFFEEKAELEGVIFKTPQQVLDIADFYKGDLRHMLNDCLEVLRGLEPNVDHYDHKYVEVTNDDLWKIYQTTAKTVAERVYGSKFPREKFFEIFREESFDTRQFLEGYYDLLEDKRLEVSKAFAIVDSRLRDNCSEIVQMNYLFSLIEDVG